MVCHSCQAANSKKFGKDRKGNQRFRCLTCRKTFSTRPERPLGAMRLPVDKAELVLHLLTAIATVLQESVHGENISIELLIQAPKEIISGESGPLDLILLSGTEQLVFENVAVENRTSLTISGIQFENGCVTFSGNCGDGAGNLQ